MDVKHFSLYLAHSSTQQLVAILLKDSEEGFPKQCYTSHHPNDTMYLYIIANGILSWKKNVRSFSVGLLGICEKTWVSSSSQAWKRATGLEADLLFIHPLIYPTY